MGTGTWVTAVVTPKYLSSRLQIYRTMEQKYSNNSLDLKRILRSTFCTFSSESEQYSKTFRIFAAWIDKNGYNMSIDTYKLTSMEEPSDEVLEQLMREAAEEATQTNREATIRFFEEIKQAAALYWYEYHRASSRPNCNCRT